MKKCGWMFGLLVALLACGGLLQAEEEKAKDTLRQIRGKVVCEYDDEKKLTEVAIDDGDNLYVLELDGKAKELAAKMNGKTVKATVLQKVVGEGWDAEITLTLKSYKEVQEEEVDDDDSDEDEGK